MHAPTTAPERGLRTLVLTDLVDSTKMVERQGDAIAAELIALHDRCARDLLLVHGGREIDKSDGFLMLFESPTAAVRWALAYHAALVALSAEVGVTLRARAGIHVGHVMLWHNRPEDVARGAKPLEVEGIAKPTAARLMGAGGGGQTLLSRTAYELARQSEADLGPGLVWLDHGEYEFKGVAEPVEVFEVGVPGIAPLEAPSSGGKVRRRQTPNNLPAEPTSFVGRLQVLAEIAAHFDGGARLVTLLGPGGMGKTRTSMRYAHEHLDRYPGGVFFCELTEAKDAGGVCQAVANALKVPLTIGEPARQLADAIAGRGPLLLVLDNFEQVASEAAATVGTWLAAAPDARFLVSSREPLHLAHEQRLRLGSLPVPAAGATLEQLEDNEAVRLFVMRAAAVKSGFTLSPQNADDIAAIVGDLDGLPLAIELAAARVSLLAPAMLRRRLAKRFDLLRGQARDVPQRQATLRGAIDWSWDLLDPWDKAGLAQCSAFVGGFSLDAAEAVIDLSDWPDAPFAMDVVQSLVDKSLVRPPEEEALLPRFTVSASIRAYAEEKMADSSAVPAPDGAPTTGPDATRALHDRHAAFFAQLGEDDALAALDQHGGEDLVRTIQAEIGNLEAAIQRVLRTEPDLAAQACLAAAQVYRQRGPFSEGARLAAQVLAAAPSLDPGLTGRLLVAEGSLLKLAGRNSDAGARYDKALAIFREAGDEVGEASALFWQHFLHRGEGRIHEAAEGLQRALELTQITGRRSEEGDVLGNIASMAGSLGDIEGGIDRCYEALDIHREVGNRRSEAMVLACLAVYESMSGRLEDAGERMSEALDIHREVGNRRSEGVVTRNLGYLRWEQGRLDESAELAASTLTIAREVGDRRSEAAALADLARIRREQGAFDDARRLGTDALTLCRRLRVPATEAWVRGELAELCLQAGELDAAQQEVDAGLEVSGGRIRAADGVLHGIAGELAARRGELDHALALLDTAETELRTFASRQLLGLLQCRRARVLLEAERGEPAEQSAAAARRILDDLGVGERSPLGRALANLEP